MDDKQTIMEAFERAAENNRGKPALRYKQAGRWRSKTWDEYRDEVRAAARAFIKLGVEPSNGVAIIGFNCPQWLIADLGAVFAGGCPTGIYTTSSAEQCKYIAAHCEARVVVVENAEQLAKFKEVQPDLPELRAIVMMYGDDDAEDVYSWSQFLQAGKDVDEDTLDARIDAQKPDDVCTYIYTSGTTGDPKGVMLSHDNAVFTARESLGMLGFIENEVVISYLPLSHIAEQIISLYGPMFTNAEVAFAESMDAVGDNLREVRPTLFLAVPRVWEKIQSKIVEAAAGNSALKKRISKWARGVGLDGGYADQRRTSRPLLYPLADALVFRKVRERLGLDRCRVEITSAAPISKDTLEFFLSLGIPIMEVFGMSECTGPATLSLPENYKTGKVGRAFTGTEIKIAEDGEICLRGRHVFKGYYKNPDSTAESLDDEGWLHSGDIGTLDEDGYLQITDRKKDIIITAGGENVAPQLIEGKLKGIPVVSQAVVIGDRRKYLSALLTIDPASLETVRAQSGSTAATLEEASECPKVHDWLFKQVEALNGTLARVQTIKKIALLPADLTIDGGELTPTMKVKRKVVNQKYADVIEGLYD